jgi:hypothetical protein
LTVSPTRTRRVGLLEPDDRLEQRRLADAVRADDPDDAAARHAEDRPSMRTRSPKPFFRSCASMTTLPRRGPAGIWISSKSSLRFFSASAAISS